MSLLKQTEHWKLNSFILCLLKLTSTFPKFKNKLRTIEAKNWQKIKNIQTQLNIYWFIWKKECISYQRCYSAGFRKPIINLEDCFVKIARLLICCAFDLNEMMVEFRKPVTNPVHPVNFDQGCESSSIFVRAHLILASPSSSSLI